MSPTKAMILPINDRTIIYTYVKELDFLQRFWFQALLLLYDNEVLVSEVGFYE
jgi:hypothetical protein